MRTLVLGLVSFNVLCVGFVDGEISVVQALLAELPSQFLTYMRIRNMKPIPP
jgi:hypothetical protein